MTDNTKKTILSLLSYLKVIIYMEQNLQHVNILAAIS